MPIDFNSASLRRRQMLDQLLRGRNSYAQGAYGDLSSNLASRRTQMFQSLGLSPESSSFQVGNLQNELNRGISANLLGTRRGTLGLQNQVLGRRQGEAVGRLGGTQGYLRQGALTRAQQAFEAAQAEEARRNQLSMQDISEQYADKGIDAQRGMLPQVDYESALIRGLFGLGGTAATYGLLKKYGK